MSRRILIVSEDYPPYPGGVAQWAAGMALALNRRGHSVTVLSRERGTPAGEPGAESLTLRTIRGRRWRQFRSWHFRRAAGALLDREPQDLVIATTWNAARGIAGPVLRRGGRLACVAHGLEVTRRMPRLKRLWLAHTLRRCECVIAVSAFTRDSLRERFRIDPDRLFLLSNGVDPSVFRPGLDASRVRERHGLLDRRVILTLARVVERKGHDLVIRALPQILSRVPDAVYLVAGPGEAGLLNRLRRLADELGVGSAVVFAGSLPGDEVPLYYNACEVYVMPSRVLAASGDTEGFGITFLEANACGKPVVGGRSGGVADAIEDGITGFLVDPADPGDLAEKILILLANPDRARAMGQAGRGRVQELHTWDRIAALLSDRLKLD
jgi:phosphatidylinositol alpha-1,6-mannosyltransferase